MNRPIGCCQYSDITVFSFHPVKIITTAEGGLATTNNQYLLQRMKLYRSHGITRNPDLMTKEPEGDWYYQQIDLGFNYRMTDLQAALGVSQMKRLDECVALRHKYKLRYDQLLKDLTLTLPYQSQESYSALHLYPIQINRERSDSSRKEVFQELRDNGIGVNVHYLPIHMHPYYQNMGFQKSNFPNSEHYYDNAISIPLFHTMTVTQQDAVVAVLKTKLK